MQSIVWPACPVRGGLNKKKQLKITLIAPISADLKIFKKNS